MVLSLLSSIVASEAAYSVARCRCVRHLILRLTVSTYSAPVISDTAPYGTVDPQECLRFTLRR